MQTTQIVEALLFASDAPLTAGDIARADDSLDEDTVEAAVQELRAHYEATSRAFQIYEVAGGYQILTLPDFAPYLERFATIPQSPKLSQAALEALAVIAYRQPIDRSEIEEIRGVASSGVLRTLQDRGLIDVVGRGEGLGRPMLYGTTSRFLEHFGFRSLEDLPRSEELPVVLTGVEPPPARREDDPEGLIEPEVDEVEQAGVEGAALAGRPALEFDQPEPSAEEVAAAIAAANAGADADVDFDVDAVAADDDAEDDDVDDDDEADVDFIDPIRGDLDGDGRLDDNGEADADLDADLLDDADLAELTDEDSFRSRP